MNFIEWNHKHSMAGVPFFGGNMLTGQQLKEEGIKIVLSRNERWSEHILHVLENFCAVRKEKGQPQFVLEEFRRHCRTPKHRYTPEHRRTPEHCRGLGIAEPRHHNAWGAIAREAARKGLIEWTGECCQAKAPLAHARIIKVWRVV